MDPKGWVKEMRDAFNNIGQRQPKNSQGKGDIDHLFADLLKIR